MKRNFYLLIAISILLLSGSCKKYLDSAPELDVTEKDVFTNFTNFQGYVNDIYNEMTDVTKYNLRGAWCWGDEAYTTTAFSPDAVMDRGQYANIYNNFFPFSRTSDAIAKGGGLWDGSWSGIKKANFGLQHLNDLTNATDEEKRLIKGQLYFFRAYYHFVLMRLYGGLPYIDKFLQPGDNTEIPRLNYHETAEKVELDLNEAIDLLPANWDSTAVGKKLRGGINPIQNGMPSTSPNTGLITKGAAIGVRAMNLMYAASPLMNGSVTGSFTYNKGYCERAAAAAYEVIKLADQGYYQLEPWATYADVFCKRNKDVPSRKEIILTNPIYGAGVNIGGQASGSMVGNRRGGGGRSSTPTDNFVLNFEDKTGHPVTVTNATTYNPVNRDPRYDFNIRTSGQPIVTTPRPGQAGDYAQYYTGGLDYDGGNSLTGYQAKKYAPQWYHNKPTAGTASWTFEIAELRLSEVYLIFSEMANEAYGPTAIVPGTNLTATAAANIVRTRAGQVNIPIEYLGSTDTFRPRIWAERSVELAYEGKRWYDIRRWYVAHLPQYKEEYGVELNKAMTVFTRKLMATRVFDLKHYWIPFPNAQVSLYGTFYQNPGW
jgi:hypothetical protein